jgi:methanogenic corrinoid protein MtbC1
VDALVAYDSEAATRLLDEAGALLSVEDLCLSIVQPALYEIGSRWQHGDIPVSGEHFATSFAVRRLGSLFNASRPEQGAGPIVAACLEGELHEAGLLMTCLFLSRRGYRVIYLGPNLPTEDLIAALADIQPPLVLLSASTPDGAADLARSSREIKESFRALGDRAWSPRIGFGGRAFHQYPHLADLVEGVYCGQDATQAVDLIDAVLSENAGDAAG